MYVEINGPAIRVEHDRENEVGIRYMAQLCKEIPLERGNPNIDCYFDPDFLCDYTRHTVNGDEWELDIRSATVSIDLTVEEALEAAGNRAAEDHTTTERVLERWSSYKDAPSAVSTALYSVRVNEEPPNPEGN